MAKQKIIIYIGVLLAGIIIVFTVQYVVGVTFGGNINMGGLYKMTDMVDGSSNADSATYGQLNSGVSVWSEGVGYAYYNSGNIGIGTTNPGSDKLRVEGGVINAVGGLVIESRDDITGDPASPTVGRIWICTDAGGDCQ